MTGTGDLSSSLLNTATLVHPFPHTPAAFSDVLNSSRFDSDRA